MFKVGGSYTIVVTGRDGTEQWWYECKVLDFDGDLLKHQCGDDVRILSVEGGFFRYAIEENVSDEDMIRARVAWIGDEPK